MRKILAGMAVAVALTCMSSVALAALMGPRPSVNPTTYSSMSGEFALFVDPTDLFARGPADYRFSRSGTVVWVERLPFTLYDVGITDAGQVIGYAYTNGLAGGGDFIVVIFSEKGEIVFKETHSRTASRFEDEVPYPQAKGVIVDGLGKRAIIRIPDPDLNRGIEQWWVYDLVGCKRLDNIEPERSAGKLVSSLIVTAKAVPGTPLVLTNWWEFAQDGPVFVLVDQRGKNVWSLRLDNDYSVPSDEKKEDSLHRLISQKGAILDVRPNGTFDLHFVKDGLRVSFEVVELSTGEWEVKKTGQSPYEWDSPASQLSLPALDFEKLGEISFSAGLSQKEQPIRDIRAFEFDPTGRICALRAGIDDAPRLLLLSQEGEVLGELGLPFEEIPKDVQYSNPANVGDSRFIISVSGIEKGSVAQWFLADFDAGTVKELDTDECPTVEAVAGFPDGRFAALTTRRTKYSQEDGIYFLGPDGKLLWKKEQGGTSGKPDDLLSPEDIVSYGADGLAVLDNIKHTIQIFETTGAFSRVIDLEKAWGRKPSYPTDLAADREGGFIVYDFGAQKTLVQVDGNGAILAEAVPKLKDGSQFRVVDGVKRSPQGALWTSDGYSLVRLSADYIADLTLGQEPKQSSLSELGPVEVGMDNRVYIMDGRTKTVHVFDPSGSLIGQCSPTAEDLAELSSYGEISVSRNGDIWLQGLSGSRYLHFRNDMTREGWVRQIDTGVTSQGWYFQPSSDLCWVKGYNDIFLVEDLRKTIRKISRRADGRWLEYPREAAVAPDGSLAVLAQSEPGEHSINIYTPSGDAKNTFDLPLPEYTIAWLAFDGQHVFIYAKNDVFVYRHDGHGVGQFTFPPGTDTSTWRGPYLAKQGKELWFVAYKGMKLHRYAVPVTLEKESEQHPE